jgi:HEAT repeat protein
VTGEEREPLLEPERLLEAAKAGARSPAPLADDYWNLVAQLQRCNPERVWALVVPLADADFELRRLVPDVLRYLGGRPQPLLQPTIELFEGMLGRPQPKEVLHSIAMAFVDLSHPSAADLLEPLTRHSDPEVRLGAVHGLLPIAQAVVPILVRLSDDEHAEVRNWATFGLSSRLGRPGQDGFVDSDEIRDALLRRLDDAEEIVRAEAVLGLAKRGDRRALPAVITELERVPEWDHFAEAAELLADPTALPALERIGAMDDPPFDVGAALAACRGAG